ncbi:aminomethyltransferase, mitochondrial isoform X2 [Cimex lectularius]|nr:aminomethyltransferase, mitochondrial isoform X2 [Cimex lectularius]
MVNFCGFQLPVQYGTESITESHLHTRKFCSVFDVSHMLQTEIVGKHRVEFMESLCTADIAGMPENGSSLSLYTEKDNGGILDDLIVTKCNDHLYIVSNASMRDQDSQLMLAAKDIFNRNGKDVNLTFYNPEQRSLLAVQGPKSQEVLQPLVEGVDLKNLYFMSTTKAKMLGTGVELRITRCGYTGEDGFEVSIDSKHVQTLAEMLVKNPYVKLAGLGARDTLRLEAGLCLYGNDIDTTTTPVSAVLMWTVGKRRRQAQDFPGAKVILSELKQGPLMKRVGLISTVKKSPPFRQGALVIDKDGREVGKVTSGCPSPSLGVNIAMGYVKSEHCRAGTQLSVRVRNTDVDVEITKMPFVKGNYYHAPQLNK